MVKKIERPDWRHLIGFYTESHVPVRVITIELERWFDTNIEPINKALDEAVEIVRCDNKSTWSQDTPCPKCNDKALLINIERIPKDCESCGRPLESTESNDSLIKKETCVDIVKEILRDHADADVSWTHKYEKRLRAAIARKEDK